MVTDHVVMMLGHVAALLADRPLAGLHAVPSLYWPLWSLTLLVTCSDPRRENVADTQGLDLSVLKCFKSG